MKDNKATLIQIKLTVQFTISTRQKTPFPLLLDLLKVQSMGSMTSVAYNYFMEQVHSRSSRH